MTATKTKPTDEQAPDAKIVRFATDDPRPEVDSPIKLDREHPRDGEGRYDWFVTVARMPKVGLMAHDASLSAARKKHITEELLARAAEDEIFGSSPVGRTLLAADETWQRMNPTIEGDLGSLGDRSRDLLGRSVRGPARAVSLVLETLTEDPTTTLTPAETELLRSLAPEVLEAIGSRERIAAEHGEKIVVAVNAAQLTYPPGEPGPAVDRREADEEVAS